MQVPLLVVISPAVKPVTLSLKVTVTGMGEVLVGSGAAELMAKPDSSDNIFSVTTLRIHGCRCS